MARAPLPSLLGVYFFSCLGRTRPLSLSTLVPQRVLTCGPRTPALAEYSPGPICLSSARVRTRAGDIAWCQGKGTDSLSLAQPR